MPIRKLSSFSAGTIYSPPGESPTIAKVGLSTYPPSENEYENNAPEVPTGDVPDQNEDEPDEISSGMPDPVPPWLFRIESTMNRAASFTAFDTESAALEMLVVMLVVDSVIAARVDEN